MAFLKQVIIFMTSVTHKHFYPTFIHNIYSEYDNDDLWASTYYRDMNKLFGSMMSKDMKTIGQPLINRVNPRQPLAVNPWYGRVLYLGKLTDQMVNCSQLHDAGASVN